MPDCNIEMSVSGSDSFSTVAEMLSGLSDETTDGITDLYIDAEYGGGGSTETVFSGDQAVPNAIWLLSGMENSERDASGVEVSTRTPRGELSEMPPDHLTDVSADGEQPSADTTTESDGNGADATAQSGDSHGEYPGNVRQNSRGHYVLWLLAQTGAYSIASGVSSTSLAERSAEAHAISVDAASTELSRLFNDKSLIYRQSASPTDGAGNIQYVYWLNEAGQQEISRLGEPADDPDDLLFATGSVV